VSGSSAARIRTSYINPWRRKNPFKNKKDSLRFSHLSLSVDVLKLKLKLKLWVFFRR
jgi:hypothetical protein